MCKFNSKKEEVIIRGKKIKIDKCMVEIIKILNKVKTVRTLACCCGHGKYPPSIIVIVKPFPVIREVISHTEIPRKKKYYKLDKEGHSYIPELAKMRVGEII